MQAPPRPACQQRRVTAGLETTAALRHDRHARFGAREAMMTTGITRRQFHTALGWGAASVALAELGLSGSARAEENFTLASTGASWGEGLKASFIDAPKFEEAGGGKVTQEFAIDSVFTAKAMASCGTPPFSSLAVLQAEANFLALGGCLEDYNLDIVTNYKDIVDSAKEPPRGALKNWFAPFVLIVMGLVYNTKEATKPASYQDLLNPKYKGKVGIPAYGWVGNSWLQVLNKTLGGTVDNVDPGIAFLSELVKKNEAVILENTDAAMKAFTREEIVVMPFWNGRTFVLQSQGVPVDIEYIPGTMLVGNGFPILRGGKFIERTNRFVNITMDGQYQMMMTKRFFYPPSNRNAKLGSDMAKYAFPADKEKNVVAIDYEKMNAHKSQYLDRWNKEVLGA
jgi:putative spermidine/putrescine transport system substrate-binding protein